MPSRSTFADLDDYPSLLWIVIPPALLVLAYLLRKWYLRRKLRLYGIGKGAPGFQTGVKQIRVTPEIAARIGRGEEVSSEEIARAVTEAEVKENRYISEIPAGEREQSNSEWLPDSVSSPKKRPKKKKKKG